MIYYDIHTPATMPAALLDEYLAKGWYRMQQTIFTTDVIIKNELVIPVFWLRLVLKRYNETKTSRKIIELNKDCTVTITQGTTITAEAEELYQLYKSSVTFEVSPTITDYLLGDTIESIYNTHCIEIRLQDQLIALGYFDEGANSLAGILNIYHPGFKNRSLGKYLMLLKINYALEKQLPFYYPGYISTSYAKFDYKLFPGKEAMEVYISITRQWRPWLSVTAEELEELLFMSNNGEQSY